MACEIVGSDARVCKRIDWIRDEVGRRRHICTTGTVLVTRCMCGTGTHVLYLYTRTMKSNIRRSTAVVCVCVCIHTHVPG